MLKKGKTGKLSLYCAWRKLLDEKSERGRKMKKLLMAMGLLVALTGCGAGEEEPEVTTPEVEEETTGGEEATGDFDATAAEESYEKSCIACHGQNLQGAVGPALAGTELTEEEILTVLHEGQGTMVSQVPQNLTEEEAVNLTKWIKSQ